MFGRIKRRKSDIIYSQYRRKLKKYRCEICGKVHDPTSKNLGVSHFWPRNHESTRFDDENCDVLCNIPCHEFFESHRTEYKAWKLKCLGRKNYDLLELKKNQYKKRDDYIDLLIAKELLKYLLNEREKT